MLTLFVMLRNERISIIVLRFSLTSHHCIRGYDPINLLEDHQVSFSDKPCHANLLTISMFLCSIHLLNKAIVQYLRCDDIVTILMILSGGGL